MVRKAEGTVWYKGKKVKLKVPPEQFFVTVLMMFGEPELDFRIHSIQSYENFSRLMNGTELGARFTQCVIQCGGLRSQRWQLYHMYYEWHRKKARLRKCRAS